MIFAVGSLNRGRQDSRDSKCYREEKQIAATYGVITDVLYHIDHLRHEMKETARLLEHHRHDISPNRQTFRVILLKARDCLPNIDLRFDLRSNLPFRSTSGFDKLIRG